MISPKPAASSFDPVAVAQRLIRAPSVTPTDAGAMDIVAAAARDAGFSVHIFDSCEGQHCVKNLVARRGVGRPMLAFVGHTDVVPPGDEQTWKHPPFAAEIHDDVLYGRGAVDMKSAIAAFIAATHPSKLDNSAAQRGSLSLLITGDEEVGSRAGMRAIMAYCEAHDMLPDVALVGEASNEGFLGQGMRIGRRGSLNASIKAHGRAGHVAWAHQAHNASHTLVAYVSRLLAYDFGAGQDPFPPTSLQVTNLTTPNQASNVVPDAASARLNIRFNPHFSGAMLQTLLAELGEPWRSELTVTTHISGEPYVCAAPALVAALSAACEQVVGHTPSRNAGGGVSDGRFLHTHCPIVEFGLVGDTAHQSDERAHIKDIYDLTAIYARTLDGYSRSAG